MTRRHSYTKFIFASTSGLLLLLTSALAQEPDGEGAGRGAENRTWFGGSPAYDFCLSQIESDPQQAIDRAFSWQEQGGGPPALHCAAVALVSMGLYADGADRLDQLAQDPANGLGAELRAEIFVQAANAWMLEGFPGQALESLRVAEALLVTDTLQPRRAQLVQDIHFDRARAHVMDDNWPAAIESINHVLAINPQLKEALVLRATGYRVTGEIDLAFADLEQILLDDLNYAPAYLERGVLWRMGGDDNAARTNWIRVLQLEPNGDLGDAARRHLHDLDFPDGMAE